MKTVDGMKTAAIIGCGRPPQNTAGHKIGWGIAGAHARGYREAFPQVQLYAVDVSAENLAAFAQAHGLPQERCFPSADALYEALTPDAVSICTWPGLHQPLTIQAARRGVPAITCEKPLALDGQEIQSILDVARRTGVRIAVAHQRRYEWPYAEAKRLIDSGLLGQQLVFEGRVGDDWDMLCWTVHWFDMANYFFDGPPKWVLAGIDHRGERRYGHAVERASTVFAEYEGGRQAIFITGPAGHGVSVRGERGMLRIGAGIQLWTEEGYRQITAPPTEMGAFGSLFADLWSSVGTDAISRCDIERTAVATQMAFAAHESARTQRRVDLPLQTWFAPLEVMQHPPQPPAEPSLRITLLADAHQEWPGVSMSGRTGLIDALAALGHVVTLVDVAQRDPTPADLAGADVLVLYHTQRKASQQTRDVLAPWFEAGRPVLVSHCGIGAYADWPQYRQWIGHYWSWPGEAHPPSDHPHLPASLHVTDPAFAVPWAQAWLPSDEVYINLPAAAPVRVLVTARTERFETPYAWQTIAHPHVITWLPGHRADMFGLEVVRDGLRAALRLLCPPGQR